MVVSYAGDPTPKRGGRRRRHYVMAVAGEHALGRAYRAFAVMSAGYQETLAAL